MQFTQRERVIMREAFIMGRLYMAAGEPESKEHIDALVGWQCELAIVRQKRSFLRRLFDAR